MMEFMAVAGTKALVFGNQGRVSEMRKTAETRWISLELPAHIDSGFCRIAFA